MSTTQPTVEEQVARIIDPYAFKRVSNSAATPADHKAVEKALAKAREILSLRSPGEVGELVNDPVVRALEAYEAPDGTLRDNPDTDLALHKACRDYGWKPFRETAIAFALRRKVALQAAEIERLRYLADTDAEVAAIMAKSDEEILADCRAEGRDPEAVADDMRRIVELATADAERLRRGPEGEVGKIAREYRPSMDAEVLHSWAKEAAAELTSLSAERVALVSEVDRRGRHNEVFRVRLTAAEAALAKTVEALGWYADPENYALDAETHVAAVDHDAGFRASESLVSISPVKGMKTNG